MRPKELGTGVMLDSAGAAGMHTSEQRPAGLGSAHRCFLGLPLRQMRSARLFDNVGMCLSSVLHYEQLLLVCTLGSARGCLGSTCIFSAPENNFARRGFHPSTSLSFSLGHASKQDKDPSFQQHTCQQRLAQSCEPGSSSRSIRCDPYQSQIYFTSLASALSSYPSHR